MKKQLLYILIVFTAIYTNAQITFRSSIPNFSEPHSLAMKPDSSWVIGEHLIQGEAALSRITLLDKNGIVKKTVNIDTMNLSYISRLLPDASGNIYALGIIMGDCDVISDELDAVFKFDKNLGLIWKKAIFLGNGFEQQHGGFAFDSKGNLQVISNGGVSILDTANGSVLHKDSITNDFFTDIFMLPNDERLITSKQSVLLISNGTGILKSKTLSNTFVRSLGNYLYAAASDSNIILFDSGLNIIKSYNWKNNYAYLYDIASNGTSIYATVSNAWNDTINTLLQFDMELNYSTQKKLSRLTNGNCILATNSLIAIAGTDMTDDNKFRSQLLVMDTAKNLPSITNNIGVIRTITTGIHKDVNYQLTYDLDLDIVVKNFGNTTIKQFTAYTDGSQQGFCFFSDPSVAYSGLSLAPGDSIRLTLGVFLQSVSPNQTSISFKVCAYTCSPNDMPDNNTHNDSKCDTYFYTGIETESQNTIGNIRLFPNPSSNLLHIQSDKLLNANYEVINTLGQAILTGKSGNTSSFVLNIETLPAGVYYLQLQDEKNISRLKFIKE